VRKVEIKVGVDDGFEDSSKVRVADGFKDVKDVRTAAAIEAALLEVKIELM